MGTTLKNDLGLASALTSTIVPAVIIAAVHACQGAAVLPKMLEENAVPARFIPMTMMTGPTTMGGKNLRIFCTPTSLMMTDRRTYTRPAHTSASMTASARGS